MMIFSLVAMIGLEKCCITSACLQWLCLSGERTVDGGPLVFFSESVLCGIKAVKNHIYSQMFDMHVTLEQTI